MRDRGDAHTLLYGLLTRSEHLHLTSLVHIHAYATSDADQHHEGNGADNGAANGDRQAEEGGALRLGALSVEHEVTWHYIEKTHRERENITVNVRRNRSHKYHKGL